MNAIPILKQLPELETPEARRLMAEARQEAFDRRVLALILLLRMGSVGLAEWADRMKREVKTLHLTLAAIGKGDWRDMLPDDWDAVAGRVREQYGYLQGMVDDLVLNDGQPLTTRWDQRALMYAGSAWGSFQLSEMAMQMRKARVQYKWVLNPLVANCLDCIFYASQGFVPIGAFAPAAPGTGHTRCVTNCHCHLVYKN